MRKIIKRIISGVLAGVMLFSCMPLTSLAATVTTENEKVAEVNDDYISMSVSKDNGGFLIDTLLGNQLKHSDDNKNLLFPSEGYDTSFTSFQITRKDGKMEEYVFGRKYGFLGINSTDVEVKTEGSSIISTWGVKDLTIVQTLTMMDEVNPQHGLVEITYDVTSSKDDVANVKTRIMLDTALGSSDYGFYKSYSSGGGYDLVTKESVVEDAYDNILMSVVGDGSSPVTAYTVNAIDENAEEQKPYQVAFGHWANLATTVFDFVPDLSRPALNNPYDGKYLTADSAYALYYDLGAPAKDETVSVTTYYGVYSNVDVSENETVAINFAQLPTPMKIKDGSSLESASYVSQIEGGKDGDIEVRMLLENYSQSTLDEVTVVVKTMNNIATYGTTYTAGAENASQDGNSYTTRITNLTPGKDQTLNLYFNVTPLNVSEYRYFEVEVYKSSVLTEANLIGNDGFYLLCPSVLGEEVSFNTTSPQTIYSEGTRTLHISGEHMDLLKNKGDYVAYLEPVNDTNAGSTVSTFSGNAATAATIIPGKNIFINEEDNSMNVVVDSAMATGDYQLVFKWNDANKAAVKSQAKVNVSDDPAYMSPVYGVVTIEKTEEYDEEEQVFTYQIGTYATEEEYEKYWEEQAKAKNPRYVNEEVLLEYRGNFTMKYDEAGNIIEATATSVKNSDGTYSGSINISNALLVEGGYVTLTVENPGAEDQNIKTAIDGHVTTSGENTTVWDGVCAITDIENGELNQLVQYYQDGSVDGHVENTTALANTISLLWPSAAGTMQTLCGMFFELRYCEFGQIAKDYHDKDKAIPEDADKFRVIAFSAILDPSFLLPTDFKWKERETSTMDAVQLTMARKHYTSQQLVEYDKKFKKDIKNWMAAQEGTLVICVDNILFGDNRFIGFDSTVEIGLPSYFDGIGGIEGTLHLVVWLLDPAEKVYMEFGVDGGIDLEIVTIEATLVLKSINGIPIPDELYLYVGAEVPGWNVDGVGVLWLNGLGGGFSNLYDSIMSKSKVPAFTVSLEGGFGLFQVLNARVKLSLSARHFAVDVKDIAIGKGSAALTLFPWMGVKVQWYPKMYISAGIEVDIISIIEGGGYVVLEENKDTGKIFFEAFATCKVKTPKIPLIGSITLGGVDLGVDLDRIYGVLHILKLDMGVCYYWGGEVDFGFGKYEVPEPTLCAIPVGTMEDGTPVYMGFGTNMVEVANSFGDKNAMLASADGNVVDPDIASASDKLHHTIILGHKDDYAKGDMALTVNYTADSVAEARELAMGGMIKEGMKLTDAEGNEYPLTWLDTTGELDASVADLANALLTYDEETKEASVTISFTEEEDYGKVWSLSSQAACELVLYRVGRLADVESVSYATAVNSANGYEETEMTVNWTGNKLDELDKLSVYAVETSGEEETMYLLYETEDTAAIQAGTASFTIPETQPTGIYTIKVNAKDTEGNVNDVEEAEAQWSYVNKQQPGNPSLGTGKLGGDYTIDVPVTPVGDVKPEGYMATIYEYKQVETEDGLKWEWVESDYAQQLFEVPAENRDKTYEMTVGGNHTTTVRLDAEGNEVSYSDYLENPELVVSTETREFGLDAGVKYKVGICAFAFGRGGNILYTEEQFTNEIVMVEPDPATVTVEGKNVKVQELNYTAPILGEDGKPVSGDALTLEEKFNKIDVYAGENVKLQLTSDMAADITWILDEGRDSELTGEGAVSAVGGSCELSFPIAVNEEGAEAQAEAATALANGEHVLKIHITNANGDESNALYSFKVDTVAPPVMLTSPENGAFFGETVTVTGVSEAGAVIEVLLNGKNVVAEGEEAITADAEGKFSVEIPMDTDVYEHTISISAADAAGNTSRSYDMSLLNEMVADKEAELAIYLNGEDVTGQEIPAGTVGKLELRYVIKDSEGNVTKVLAVPHDSNQGNQVIWDLYTVAGTAELIHEEGALKLTGSTDVNGMLVATLDKQQLSAVLGGNPTSWATRYSVTLPEETEGYTIETEDPLMIAKGYSFRFKVNVAEGYSGDAMKVMADGEELTAVEGVYTISNITEDVEVTVTGVADITAPEVTITAEDKWWSKFFENITFGIFFKAKKEITVTAEDAGSGIKDGSIYYYVHTTGEALSEDEVMNLSADSWTPYAEAFSIDTQKYEDGEYIVYARVEDNASLRTYVNTDGLVLKSAQPVIGGVENGGTYHVKTDEAVTVTITDKYLDTLTVDDVAVDLAEKGYDGTGNVVIDITADNEKPEHTIRAVDKAGNEVSCTFKLYEQHKITFSANGNTQTVWVNHGGSLKADDFPEIPEGTIPPGCTQTAPYWNPATDLENVTQDMMVNAVYIKNVYTVTLPANPVGYGVTPSALVVQHGEDFSFTLDVAKGYNGAERKVKCNGELLQEKEGIYTVTVVTGNLTITVEGIVDDIKPDVVITMGEDSWREFVNSITFGKFYKENQKVEIAATDAGSGVGADEADVTDGISYLLDEKLMTEAELSELNEELWKPYEGAIYLTPDSRSIVYARAVDNDGNVTYVHSEGIVVDNTAPDLAIKVGTNTWNKLWNSITFGYFFKETQRVEITAVDGCSGIDENSVYYYLSDKELSEAEVKNLDAALWNVYTESFNVAPESKYIIYAKAADKSTNMTYVSSEGLILETVKPVISGVADGNTYYGDTTFTVADDYLDVDTVKVDGNAVALTEDGKYTIPADNAEHTIVAADKAGNTVSCKITIYEIHTVTFMADGVVVDTVEVKHGANLEAEDYPAVSLIPVKEGYDRTKPVWDSESLTGVMEDMTVEAVYTINEYAVTIPADAVGYTVTAVDNTMVAHGKSFRFKVEVADGYTETEEYAVYANTNKLTKKDGVYTITEIKDDMTILVKGVEDVTSPVVEVKVSESSWNSFLNTITFGKFFKETQNVEITAADAGSGVNAICYKTADTAMTLDAVKTMEEADWTPYSDTFTIEPNAKYVIYVKAQDNAGNVTYISSDGLILENTAPVISGIVNGQTYYGDTVFTVTDEYLGNVKVDGKEVALIDGKYTISADNAEHTIVAADKAGNTVSVTVTVCKLYTVTLPADTVGYRVIAVDDATVAHGESFRFKLEIADGYTTTNNFKVSAGGVELMEEDGVYTIENVCADTEVVVVGICDISSPAAEIKLGTKVWEGFCSEITFNSFYNEAQEIELATDTLNSNVKLYYYIANTQKSLEEVKAITDWTEYTAKFSLKPDNQYIVYVKAVNDAAMETYISSEGIVVEDDAPVISGIEDGKTYHEAVTLEVTDEYLSTVKLDGKEVALTDGKYTVPVDNAQHTIEAVDKAGNTVSCKISLYKIYTPKLPVNADGYRVVAIDDTAVSYGNSFAFRVEIEDGYTATKDFAVYANGIKLKKAISQFASRARSTVVEGVYIIENVQSDITITVEGVEDVTAPDAEVKVSDNVWNSFINTITFGSFFKETQNVKITAEDAGSGVRAIYYHISDGAKTWEEVQVLPDSEWTEYSDIFTIAPDAECVIYVKVLDQAGNGAYISSDGLILENTAPTISGIENEAIYHDDVTFTVEDEYLDTVKVDGKAVTLTAGKYTISADDAEHTIEAADKAGNTVVYKIYIYEPDEEEDDEDAVVIAPKTGDYVDMKPYVIIMMAVAAAVFGVIITKRRREDRNE